MEDSRGTEAGRDSAEPPSHPRRPSDRATPRAGSPRRSPATAASSGGAAAAGGDSRRLQTCALVASRFGLALALSLAWHSRGQLWVLSSPCDYSRPTRTGGGGGPGPWRLPAASTACALSARLLPRHPLDVWKGAAWAAATTSLGAVVARAARGLARRRGGLRGGRQAASLAPLLDLCLLLADPGSSLAPVLLLAGATIAMGAGDPTPSGAGGETSSGDRAGDPATAAHPASRPSAPGDGATPTARQGGGRDRPLLASPVPDGVATSALAGALLAAAAASDPSALLLVPAALSATAQGPQPAGTRLARAIALGLALAASSAGLRAAATLAIAGAAGSEGWAVTLPTATRTLPSLSHLWYLRALCLPAFRPAYELALALLPALVSAAGAARHAGDPARALALAVCARAAALEHPSTADVAVSLVLVLPALMDGDRGGRAPAAEGGGAATSDPSTAGSLPSAPLSAPPAIPPSAGPAPGPATLRSAVRSLVTALPPPAIGASPLFILSLFSSVLAALAGHAAWALQGRGNSNHAYFLTVPWGCTWAITAYALA